MRRRLAIHSLVIVVFAHNSAASMMSIGVANYGDNVLNSVALFDAVAVPEPSTYIAGALLLLPLGLSTSRVCARSRTFNHLE